MLQKKMEEDNLKQSLATYQQQLQQVEQAIQAAGASDDLKQLKIDLEELIELTEGSLLSLKKSQLLKQLDDSDTGVHGGQGSKSGSDTGQQGGTAMDEEYAAFQAMLSDDVTQSDPTPGPNVSQIASDEEDASTCPDTAGGLHEVYKDLIGTKCRAPFSHDWGSKSHGNALISGVEVTSEVELPKVRVMFSNPTHSAMLPCKYFLDGNCRFSETDCRFSHGYIVSVEDLQEYEDPDYSQLRIESLCLACYNDDLWYLATVVDLTDDSITVTFDSYDDEPVKLSIEDVLPLGEKEDDSITDEGRTVNDKNTDSEDEEDELPVFLWKPPQSPSVGFGDLGQWEAHTKGIGSKLMAQMGYKPGEGLGKNGEGRIQPVPIELLPQGKSLDRIMQLKEIAGNRDLFDAMKKQERKMKKQADTVAKGYEKKEKTDVFDFINKRLGGKKGKLSDLVHKHEGQSQSTGKQGRLHRNISEQDLSKKSGKDINIQLLKTEGEIKSVEKELVRLRQSLSRNQDRDKNVAARFRTKIQSLESYLEKLKSSEATMTGHQQKRSDHRKLTVF